MQVHKAPPLQRIKRAKHRVQAADIARCFKALQPLCIGQQFCGKLQPLIWRGHKGFAAVYASGQLWQQVKHLPQQALFKRYARGCGLGASICPFTSVQWYTRSAHTAP